MRHDLPFVRRLGLALLTASVPLVVMLLVLVIQGYQWGNHAPVLSDEIYYWHQAATWGRAGVNGGYYVIDDTPARAAVSHYYAWGFGPPIFYGTFAALFGWPLNGVLHVNALFFFMSVVVFVLLARLDARHCGLLALLLAVYPALLVYLPTSMLEPIYLGGALILAGGLVRLHQGERQTWVIVLTGGVLVLLCIMRFTWTLMFWPYLYYLAPWKIWTLRRRTAQTEAAPPDTPSAPPRLQGRDIAAPLAGERRWLWSLIGAVGLSALFFFIYNVMTSPYPYALTLILGMIRTEPANAFFYYINMVTESIISFLYPSHGPSIALRWVAATLLLWAMAQRAAARTRLRREAVTLILYIMGSTFVLAFFAYTTVMSVGFRFFAPYVLLSLVLLIAWDDPAAPSKDLSATRRWPLTFLRPVLRWGPVRLSILVFAITVPLVFLGLDTLKERAYAPGRDDQVDDYRQEWAALGVRYIEDADAWCNTFAYSVGYLVDFVNQDRLLALEPGFGLSIIWWTPEKVQRAQFLLLTDEDYRLYQRPDQLKRLLDVSGGSVYRNTARKCPHDN